MDGAQNHRQCVVVEDDDDGHGRQLVAVVLVAQALRVAVVGDVALQRDHLTPGHVTAQPTHPINRYTQTGKQLIPVNS